MRGVPGAQFFACWINPSPKNAENGSDKPMLNLHLNKYTQNKDRELRWVTCRITSLTSANEQRRRLTVARTCNVFVVFGFGRPASITASVRKCSCCVLCRASRWCTQTSACVPTDVTRLRHRGVSGPRGQGHKSRRLPETSSFFWLTRWQQRCHTLTRCIDRSPAMMLRSAPDPCSGVCDCASSPRLWAVHTR